MKNYNLKNLCHFLSGYSLAGVVVFFFALSFLLLPVARADASGAMVDLDISNGYLTIPSGTDVDTSAVFCSSPSPISIDGSPASVYSNPESNLYFYFLTGLSVGSHSFSPTSNASMCNGETSRPICTLFTGVNSADLIVSTASTTIGSYVSNKDFNFVNTDSDNLLFGFARTYGANTSYSTTSPLVTYLSPNSLCYSGWYLNDVVFGGVSNGDTPINLSLYMDPPFNGYETKGYLFELNTSITLPPCESYNYSDWGACNTDTNRKYRTIISSTPASCDYFNPLSAAPVLGADCVEIYDAQKVENLYFRFDTIENKCRIDMSCKLSYNFDTLIFGLQATGKVYYYPTSTSTAQYLGQINLNTQKDLGIYGVGNLVATSSASSTAYSYYQIVPHSDIYNQDYATSTALVWFYDAATFKTIYDDVWDPEITTNYLGIDTRSLACTDEQWASTSSIPFIGVNVDLLMCNTRKWLLDVGIQPMLNVQQKLFSLKEKIMTMFPMSLITSMQSSWKNSINLLQSYLTVPTCYASDFSTTTGNYTGDFSMSIPDLFGDKTGTTTISLLSKNNLENLLGVDGFNWFNIICRIIIWAAFLGYCWWLITERLHIEILKH